METNLSKVLDECIAKINKGETVEICLIQYAHSREQIGPLLHTAQVISTIPKVVPRQEFRRLSRVRLVARLCQEAAQAQTNESSQNVFKHLFDKLAMARQVLLRVITPVRRAAIPTMLTLLLLLVAGTGMLYVLSPAPALASQCTLSIFSGNAMVQEPGSNEWKQGADGMTLTAGSRIKTSADSQALLTFFEGSTTKLEANTEIEIRQIEGYDQQPTAIILKQNLGRTWSRVIKMLDQGSRYEIETPAATAIVRGTLFTTEVDETGATRVATIEGLVSVAAQGEEVYVPPQQHTEIEIGAPPTPPAPSPDAESKVVVIINQPAIGSVRDPLGSSTGNLPSGTSFNQITGSQCSSDADGSQIITIPQPASGEYVIALRNTKEEDARFRIQGKSAKDSVFEYDSTLDTKRGEGWLVHFNLRVEEGKLAGSELSHAEPLENNIPEKIVDKGPAKEKATPAETRGQGNQPEQNSGQGQANQPEQNSNQGQANQSDQNSGQGQANQPEHGNEKAEKK